MLLKVKNSGLQKEREKERESRKERRKKEGKKGFCVRL